MTLFYKNYMGDYKMETTQGEKGMSSKPLQEAD